MTTTPVQALTDLEAAARAALTSQWLPIAQNMTVADHAAFFNSYAAITQRLARMLHAFTAATQGVPGGPDRVGAAAVTAEAAAAALTQAVRNLREFVTALGEHAPKPGHREHPEMLSSPSQSLRHTAAVMAETALIAETALAAPHADDPAEVGRALGQATGALAALLHRQRMIAVHHCEQVRRNWRNSRRQVTQVDASLAAAHRKIRDLTRPLGEATALARHTTAA